MAAQGLDEGAASGGEARAGRRRWWTLVLLGTAFFMVISDSTIVYTALPSIRDGLSFSDEGLAWVVIAYLLTSGALLLLGGRVADVYGRRRTFVVGLVVFAAMSLASGLAWSPWVLVAARAAQGVGAAGMTPAALSILLLVFPDGVDRNRALGVWGALAGVGATGGLLLGGPITEFLGWRWVFLVNVPVALVVLALTPVLLPAAVDAAPARRRRLDLAGSVMITLALLAIAYAIVAGPHGDRIGSQMLVPLSLGGILLVLFVRGQRRSVTPMLPASLFRAPGLVGGNLVVLAAGMSVDGLLFTVTTLMQEVRGYPATRFGWVVTAMTATSFLAIGLGQRLVGRFGARPVAVGGLALLAVGSLTLTQATTRADGLAALLVGLVLFGLGMGAAFVAGQIAALAEVPEEDAGLASGVEETTFAIGGGLGVAVLSTIALARADLLAGTRAAFVAGAVIAVVGLVAALLLIRSGIGADNGATSDPTRERNGH